MGLATIAGMHDGPAASDANRLSQVIFEYASVIGRQQDRDALIAVIGNMGRDLVGADRCTIWLLDDSGRQLVARFAHGSQLIPVGAAEGFVGRCVATGEAILSNAPADDPRFSAAVDRHTGYRTMNVLTVPMRAAEGRIIGVFQAVNKPGGFAQSDADLLALAAAYSARTIETQMLLRKAEAARRVARDLEVAREVQQRLLAGGRRHQVAGLDFAAVCRPAIEIGGDYYDLMPLPAGDVAVAIGDISGKGIAAALMMASVQATLHGLVLQHARQPAALVSRLNELIIDAATGQYSTMFFAVYDRATRMLRAVNGGHVPPVLLRQDGAHRIMASGPPLGLLAHVNYVEEQLRLDPGDALICYSDGLTDAQNPAGEWWSESGFYSSLVSAAGRPVAEMVNHVMDAAESFAAGEKQHDDMTVVCLRITE